MTNTKTWKEVQAEWDKKFYEECTDGVDEKNDYYDSSFEGTRPYAVESFMKGRDEALRKALLEEIREEVSAGLEDTQYLRWRVLEIINNK